MTTINDHDIRVALTDASLDAPRVDLWERIDEQVIGLSRTRRPIRTTLRSLAAVLAILLAGAGMLTIFTLADDGADQRASQIDAVPDLLLMTTWDSQTQGSNLRAYLPESNGLLTVLEGVAVGDTPAISRDGKQIVYTGWQQEGDTWTLRLWSFDSATLATQWSADITTAPAATDGSGPPGGQSAVIAGERVYVSWHGWDTPGPIDIRAVDRASGAPAGNWAIDIGERRTGSPWLGTSADGSRLYVMPQVWDVANPTAEQTRTAYFVFELPSMREITRNFNETTPIGERFYPWNVGHTPDGKMLYAVTGGYSSDPLRVDFFDLDRGRLSDRVDLGFGTGFDVSQQTGVSADGRLLYVFDSSSGKLVTVDLVNRRLVDSAMVDMSILQGAKGSLLGRVWGAVSGLVVQETSAKIGFTGSMQLSPDGKRLYAIGIKGYDEAPNGVLVIDTTTWQVVDRWLAGQSPIQLIASGDGRYLYAMTVAWANQGESGMRIVDTTTGTEVAVSNELRDAGEAYTTYSVAELYRKAWGVSPAITGVDSGDLARSTKIDPYAKMSVSVSAASVMAGDPVTIELRYLDPKTGEPLTGDTDGVRYSEPGNVRALLSKNSSNTTAQTIVLVRSEYGVYRGAAVMPEAGSWSVQVIAESDGQPGRYASLRDAVVVQPVIMGEDGRRYMLSVTLVEPPARAQQETRVRISIVDAETGAPLPENVDLAGGMPEEMAGSALLELRAVTSADLTPVSHGVYEGSFNFFAAGRWNLSVNFPQDGSRSGGIAAGVVVVE